MMPLDLVPLIRESVVTPFSPGVHALKAEILSRYGTTAAAILFYGSNLRRGDDDGLVDLYVLVDSYRAVYRNASWALLNKLLPPNVFYLELPHGGRTLRSKYAVLSLSDFQRGTSMSCFHSYLWGRFAQRVGLLHARDEEVANLVLAALAQAAATFITRAVPALPSCFEARDLWRTGLSLSYGAELRAEKRGRVAGIVEDSLAYYEKLTRAAIPSIPFDVEVAARDEFHSYFARLPSWRQFCGRWAWKVRSVQGKLLSILRLMKAAFTFDGGLDYILWKIERHSGITVEVTPRLRRHPLIAMCLLSWRLYRRGAFR